MRRLSFFVLVAAPLLFCGAIARADFADGGDEDAGQFDAGGFDAGPDQPPEEPQLPDAGGPPRDDPSSEEQDTNDRVPLVCRRTAECNPGFECQAGKCRYTGIRHAEGGGCLGAVPGLVLAIGLVAVRRKR
ncbi:MAG: hypothetical protein ACJ790_04940 [Myxococcaceae bacterium]